MLRVNVGKYRALATLCLATAILLASGCVTGANALVGSRNTGNVAQESLHVVEEVEREGLGAFRPNDEGSVLIENLGVEPLQELGMQPAPGTVQQITVTQGGNQTFSVIIDGSESSEFFEYPGLELTVELTVNETVLEQAFVDARIMSATVGGVSADDIYTGAVAVDDLVGDPIILRESAALAAHLQGRVFPIVVSSSGQVLSAEPMLGDGVDFEPLVMGYFARNFLTLADPIPNTDLGIGARWTVTSPSLTESLPATVSRTYEITEIGPEFVKAQVFRTISYEPGVHENTTISRGSSLTGVGEAVWPRSGVLGAVSYSVDGSIDYVLPSPEGNHVLTQRILRSVETATELLHDATPETGQQDSELDTTTAAGSDDANSKPHDSQTEELGVNGESEADPLSGERSDSGELGDAGELGEAEETDVVSAFSRPTFVGEDPQTGSESTVGTEAPSDAEGVTQQANPDDVVTAELDSGAEGVDEG